VEFLIDGPAKAAHSILLAHGAGAPMDSPAMTAIAKSLADAGLRVARFEFGYMASRRTSSGRKPPPRADTLAPEYAAAIAATYSGLSVSARGGGLRPDEVRRLAM